MSMWDLDPEEDARRARAREAYAKMYPLKTDDPYGAKRLERVHTLTGVKRVFNQVARESGLGGLVDAPDSEQSKERLEPREIDRNACCRPTVRQLPPREMRCRRKPGWIDCRFVLPRPILEGLSLLARSSAKKYLAPIPGVVNFHVGTMARSHRDVVDQSYQVGLIKHPV
jgi:hypothetical protein